jgi:hypothetical protein
VHEVAQATETKVMVSRNGVIHCDEPEPLATKMDGRINPAIVPSATD